MGAIFFRYPTAGAPTTTLQINPAFMTIQPFKTAAIQRVHHSESGRIWLYSLSSNIIEDFEIRVTDLHELDDGSLAGAISLRNFLTSTVQYSSLSWDMTDADNVTTLVRLLEPLVELREAENLPVAGRYSGQFIVRKVII